MTLQKSVPKSLAVGFTVIWPISQENTNRRFQSLVGLLDKENFTVKIAAFAV
ncbi:hypothetical protein NKJ90_32870 [Mesorhizobium sp. M0051]|uniref:hypothetical protein n=1 Tax=unclassified Mesorhizobium TaxID=325217 RepID=UPI003337AE84